MADEIKLVNATKLDSDLDQLAGSIKEIYQGSVNACNFPTDFQTRVQDVSSHITILGSSLDYGNYDGLSWSEFVSNLSALGITITAKESNEFDISFGTSNYLAISIGIGSNTSLSGGTTQGAEGYNIDYVMTIFNPARVNSITSSVNTRSTKAYFIYKYKGSIQHNDNYNPYVTVRYLFPNQSASSGNTLYTFSMSDNSIDNLPTILVSVYHGSSSYDLVDISSAEFSATLFK